jgi:ABC-2 type transport system ATP-binding protein
MSTTSTNSASPLEMSGVIKRFPGKNALDGLNFSVAPGKVIGLLGRNGAGKTTLLECALGLREIDQGEIRLLGESPMSLSEATRGHIGYVPQQTDLFEWLTPSQMLAFFKAFYNRWNDAKVSALLDRWSIPLTTPIGKLSGGEKQRLAIIRAMAHEPDFLVLDEPVASLDPAGRRDFLRELVERTINHETTVVFSTHIFSDLERVASDVAIMGAGKIILQQPLDMLAEQTHRVIGPSAVLDRVAFDTVLSHQRDTGGTSNLLVSMAPSDDQRVASLRQKGVRIDTVALEDLFIEVTQ